MHNSRPKPVLHFVHGNSFPSATYSMFFEPLRQHYDVHALVQHCHNPAFPVSDNWPYLVQELIVALEKYPEPVVLVGHSMGGILSLMAAKARPDLVRCLVLIDAPLVLGWRAWAVRLFKRFGLIEKYSPGRFSEKRRHIWPDLESAYQHFASKEMFAIWPPQVLRDYVEGGLVPHPEGVTLRFTREVETAVYNTLPGNLGRLLGRALPVPAGFVGGTESVECRQAGLAGTRRLMGKHFVQLQGGHLLPMEAPHQTAAAVHTMITRLSGVPR